MSLVIRKKEEVQRRQLPNRLNWVV